MGKEAQTAKPVSAELPVQPWRISATSTFVLSFPKAYGRSVFGLGSYRLN